eukprot:255960-Prorocentrum_lima.AAC.1
MCIRDRNSTAAAAAPATADNDNTKTWKMPTVKMEVTEARQKPEVRYRTPPALASRTPYSWHASR